MTIEIQQLESYEILHLDDGIRLRLWSDENGRPVEFNLSPDQITMLKLELERAEIVYGEESSDTVLRQLDEMEQKHRDQNMEALREGDELGAAHAAGKVSGLVSAQEAIKDAE